MWAPVDDQFTAGIEAEFRPRSFPLGVEVGVAGSYGADTGPFGIDIEGFTGEIYTGPRITLDVAHGKIHPYVGAGVSWIHADFQGSQGGVTVSDSDGSVAGYVHAGLQFDLSDAFLIGGDFRYLYGSDIELFGVDGDADYWQVAGFIGARW